MKVYYKEFPLDDELADFDDEELRPGRRRGTCAKHKSLDDGDFNHSDCKHSSSVGLSEERIDKHRSIN